MKVKDIFKVFQRKKKDKGKAPRAETQGGQDPGGWPVAESDAGGAWPEAEVDGEGGWPEAGAEGAWPEADPGAEGAWPEVSAEGAWPEASDNPNAWPTAAQAPVDGAAAWPDAGTEASSDPIAWPTMAQAPVDGVEAWPEAGTEAGGAEGWPEAPPPAALATEDEPEDGKKKKKKGKKAKKEKKPKKEKKLKKRKKKKGEEGEEGEAAEEGEEAGGKKKLPLLFILIPAVVVIAAVVVLLLLKPWASKETEAEELPVEEEIDLEAQPPVEETKDDGTSEDGEQSGAGTSETSTAPVAPMNTAEAMNRFATFTPESLGLTGESMSEYRYYATGRNTRVDGYQCREIMVYRENANAGTNDFAGRFLLSADSRHLYRDDGNGVITELSPATIGIGN